MKLELASCLKQVKSFIPSANSCLSADERVKIQSCNLCNVLQSVCCCVSAYLSFAIMGPPASDSASETPAQPPHPAETGKSMLPPASKAYMPPPPGKPVTDKPSSQEQQATISQGNTASHEPHSRTFDRYNQLCLDHNCMLQTSPGKLL